MVKAMIRNAIPLASAVALGLGVFAATAQADDIKGYYHGPHGGTATYSGNYMDYGYRGKLSVTTPGGETYTRDTVVRRGPHGAFAARRVWHGPDGVYSRGVIGRY